MSFGISSSAVNGTSLCFVGRFFILDVCMSLKINTVGGVSRYL